MSLSTDWNAAGGAIPRGAESPSVRDLLNPLTGLTVAEVKAIPPNERVALVAGGIRLITSDGRRWRFHPTSALASDGDQLLIVPTVGSGRWLLEVGSNVDLALAIAFGTADAAVLYTMPTGAILKVDQLHWEVTADFTGGTASAIGVSTTKTTPTNWSTKGDLLGGAGGDVLATLVASGGIIAGTNGADMDTLAKTRGAIWKAADIFRFDRITDAFTAGAGFVHVLGRLLANAGA